MPNRLPTDRSRLHPVHGLLLAWPVALFPAALLSDISYLNTAEIQWTNFSAWLITGALIVGGLAIVWAIVDCVRQRHGPDRGRSAAYLLLLAAAWISGLINAFQHSRDGWASVGTAGLLLSIASSLLALAAGWIAYAGQREKRL